MCVAMGCSPFGKWSELNRAGHGSNQFVGALCSLCPRRNGASGKTEGLLSEANGGSNAAEVASELPPFFATMLDPREFAAFGSIAVAMFLSCNREAFFSLSAQSTFRSLYMVNLAVVFLVWSSEFCGHVDWLNTSGTTKRRGLSKWANPLYGFVSVPALTLGKFALVLLALIVALLIGAWFPIITPLCYALACLVYSHLFWNRQNIGGHGGLPALHTLFCLSMGTDANGDVVRACIQVMLAFSYFGSAVCKLATSLCIQRPRRWWGRAESMKFYLLDAISIRPMQGIRKLVREMVLTATSRLLPDLAMNIWLLAVTTSPVCMYYFPRYEGVAMAGFHWGAWFLFDIDFLSFWGPSLLAATVDGAPISRVVDIGAAIDASPIQTYILLAYVSVQVLMALTMYDLNPRSRELLPFSSYPMFEESTVPFEESQAMALVLHVPTAVSIPEPYYLRMQALAVTPNEKFITGPELLGPIGQKILVVGIPRGEQKQDNSAQKYSGGVWHPERRSPQTRLGNIADMCVGATRTCDTCVSATCAKISEDVDGTNALNHERESSGEAGTIALVGNIDVARVMPQLEVLLGLLTTYTTKDNWSYKRMASLLRAFDDVQSAMEVCPRAPVFRVEMKLETN